MELINHAPGELNFMANLGISEDRAVELGKMMDTTIKSFGNELHLRSSFDVLNMFAAKCNDTPELIFCVISHTSWLAKRGQNPAPPKPNSQVSNFMLAKIHDSYKLLKGSISLMMPNHLTRPQLEEALEILRQQAHNNASLTPPSKS